MAGMIPPEKPLNQRAIAFVTAFMKCGNATKAALEAGFSKKSARTGGCTLLKDPRVKSLLQSQPPVTISEEAYYGRKKAIDEYEEARQLAIKQGNVDGAIAAVDAKVRLYGLVLEPKPAPEPGAVVNNNIYSLGSDDELYDLLKRKREAGNGIDTEAIGHNVAGMAKAVSQDHRQAVKTTATRP